MTEFYTALYHSLLYRVSFSDVTYQHTGSDRRIHTVAPGHAECANCSGWDFYRGQIPLASYVLAVSAAVLAVSVPIDPGKTVASVTLPVPSWGDIGIFAIGAG